MKMYRVLLIAALVLAGACSGGEDEKSAGDAWKTQTDALEKAKEVNKTLQDSFDRQDEAIDQQGE